MRLLALHLTKPSNSEAKVLAALLDNIDDEIEVHLVLNRAGMDDEASQFNALADRPNISVHHVGVGLGADPWKPDNRILRLLSRSLHSIRRTSVGRLAGRVGADVIYTSQQRFDCRIGELVSRSMRIPHVVHLHYTPGPYLRRPTLERLRTCDAVIAISDFIRGEAVAIGVDPCRITVIHNTIAAPAIDETGDESRAGALVVGQVGRMFEGKGFLDTVRAFATVHASVPETRLLLVGDGPQRSAVEAECDRLGLRDAVVFTGWQERVEDFLGEIDVLVNPSRSEPFGMVVLEAMAHGVPVVAYRDGAMEEIVVHGRTGALVDVGDAAALGEETLRLVHDPGLRRRYGAEGRARAEQAFDPHAAGCRFSSMVSGLARDAAERSARAAPVVGFVMERHLGLGTFADNLRSFLDEEQVVRARWYPVGYDSSGWWDRVPVPSSARSALAGRLEARRVSRDSQVQAAFYNTQVPAVLAGRVTRCPPFFVSTDVTPRQYDAMAVGYGHRADRVGPLGWLKHELNRRVFFAARGVFPWSHWVARSLVEDYGVDPQRIEVIPPGVDVGTWRPRDGDRVPGPMRLLFVGGDFERKGGDLVVAAYRALPPGSAELTVVTRSRVDPTPGVEIVNDLTANDPRLLELYRSSDVFVLPSRAETFGIAYVEASACGLPVIAGRSGAVDDIVVDGVNGYVVPVGEVEPVVTRLRQLTGDPELRDRLGHNARRRAVEQFDGRANARRLARVIETSLRADRPPR